MQKLNNVVHCTCDLTFVPGTVNSVAYNTYAFDTLKVGKEVINAKELYKWLKENIYYND